MARVRTIRLTAAAVVVALGAGGTATAVALTRSSPHHSTSASAITPRRGAVSPVATASPPQRTRHAAARAHGAGSTTVSAQQPASVTPVSVHVPPLHQVLSPDAIVTFHHAVSRRDLARLRRRSGVRAVAALDEGTVRLPTGRLRVAGLPLTDVRGFTPRLTAISHKLWASIARGELTVGFSSTDRKLRHRLGHTVLARGRHGATTPLRIGAFATLDLAGAQAVVANSRSADLGLLRRREVLVAAPKISLDTLTSDIHRTLGHPARLKLTRPEPFDQSVLSTYATTVIPTSYLDLYRRAAVTCPGLPWTVLAGIGTVETGNGSNVARSVAGAEGPMQFLPSTWAMYGVDADGDGKADIQDPTDAVFSAARYLCAAGAGRGGQAVDNAIFSYNHAWWYVREVLVLANRYA